MDQKTKIIASLKKITGKDVLLEIPEREEYGDYSSSVALKGISRNDGEKSRTDKNKAEGTENPRLLAESIAEDLRKDTSLEDIVEKIEIAGPGFINFYLKNDALFDNLLRIVSEEKDFGRATLMSGKKIVIEFAHPNTHKLFHIGHLRNIATGEALSRIMEFSGAKVIRVNYQGDVGLHIAKALWGIENLGFSDPGGVVERAEYLGKAYAEGNRAYEEDTQVKEKIHQINEALYKGDDPKLMDLYGKTRLWSLEYFDFIYKRVDTKFDRLYFESEVAPEGYRLAKEALEKNILAISEGAVIFPGSKYGLHDRVFITQRDVLTYEGKDLGLAQLQFKEFDPDRLIHLVGPEQSDYFKVVFKALEMILPATYGREEHLAYGWVRLKEGKMSSRKGNVVSGNWLLDEVKKNIMDKYASDEQTAENIAVGAVKYSFLKNSLNQEIAFDINESISMEGNSGPYLQYTYARIQSVVSKSEGEESDLRKQKETKLNKEELSLCRCLMHFSESVEDAALTDSPGILCGYLYGLASKFNTFYNAHRILSEDPGELELRLKITKATGIVLGKGLGLLGISHPEKM